MRSTVEGWCETYVSTTELARKLAPPPPPDAWDGRPPVRLASPGRPPELREVGRTPRTPKPTALREPIHRAQLFAIFHHHELQAAELMCWAVLAFADTPLAFRRGLLKIALDEIEHMSRYRRHLELQGAHLSDFPVRDWFWDRVPSVPDAAGFVATMGLGFEGGNLDHTARFAGQLRRAGDLAGAAILDAVGAEEEVHVAFAVHWFRRFTGGLDFLSWQKHLAPPLSPTVMKGAVIDRAARTRAGQPEPFLDALAAFERY